MYYQVWEQKPENKHTLIAQGLTWERAFDKKRESGNYYIVPEPADNGSA